MTNLVEKNEQAHIENPKQNNATKKEGLGDDHLL